MSKKRLQILTIGTSIHPWRDFNRLLDLAGIECLIDVRARPYSRWPQFNQPELRARANYVGLPYIFMGDILGGLSKDDPRTYADVAQTPIFKGGIAKVMEVAARTRPAILCAEAEPLQCHRYLLASRALAAEGAEVGASDRSYRRVCDIRPGLPQRRPEGH